MSGTAETAPAEEVAQHDGAILDALSVTKAFGGLVAVEDVNFAIPERSIVSIIGPNGAGKTTFFNMLTGLYRPTSGRIFFQGRDITYSGRTGSSRGGWRGPSRTSGCSRRCPRSRT